MLRQVDVSGCLCVRVVDVHAAAGVFIGNCAADRPFVDVQIDLRRGDGAVAEQLLNKFDVGAFLQQEGGEGVTAAMEGNRFVYSCFGCHTLQGTVGIAEKGDVCEHPVIK